MPLLLVPIFAQALSASVGDRTELRLVIEEGDQRPEAATVPFARIALDERRARLELSYSPSFTLTPLDASDPDLLVYHNAGLVGTLRYPRTTFSLSQSAGYGERNFRVSAIESPARTGSTPPAPGQSNPAPGGTGSTPNAPGAGISSGRSTAAVDFRAVRYVELRSEASMHRELSRRAATTANLGYAISGGVGDDAQRDYPLFRGPHAGASYGYRLSVRGQFLTSSRVEYLSNSRGARYISAGIEQGYTHQFSRHFRAGVSAGLAYARARDERGNETAALYPTFGLGSGAVIEYQARVAGGALILTASAAYSPALDQIRSTLDPRVATFLGAVYTRRRLSIYLNGSGVFSLTPNDEGALTSIGAATGASYDLGAGFAVDGGVRAAWQSFQGDETIPPTYALFVGLSWGATVVGRSSAPRGIPPTSGY